MLNFKSMAELIPGGALVTGDMADRALLKQVFKEHLVDAHMLAPKGLLNGNGIEKGDETVHLRKLEAAPFRGGGFNLLL